MKSYTRDAMTGLTAIAGLLGLATMLMLFGELRNLTQEYYVFGLHLDSAKGLLSGGPVTINGVRSGEITEVRNAPDPTRGVEVEVRMREGVKVPKSFDVHIDRSLVGDATLELTPVDDPALAGQFIAPGEVVERKALTMMDDIAEQLAEPIAAINRTAENIDTLTATYDEVGRRISGLLEPRTPAEVSQGRPANIASTLARIDSAVAGAERWLGDEQLQTDARGVIGQASAVLTDASGAIKKWDAIAQTVDREVGEAGATLQALGDSAAEFRQAAHALNSGEGTLGMLLRNPDLYRSLQAAAERLERTLVEAQLLFEKYRKEGVPIQF